MPGSNGFDGFSALCLLLPPVFAITPFGSRVPEGAFLSPPLPF